MVLVICTDDKIENLDDYMKDEKANLSYTYLSGKVELTERIKNISLFNNSKI